MQRIFLLGNGPSLKETPLDLLAKETTFALNRISFIYPKTKWRPTYYMHVDHKANDALWQDYTRPNLNANHLWLLKEYRDGIPAGQDGHEFLNENNALGDLPNVTWMERCPKHSGYSGGNAKSMQEWHFPDICVSLNGMSVMIQIAVQLGYKEIYLVGCDLGYHLPYQENHFDPDYHKGVEPQNTWDAAYWISADQYNATKAHQIAKKECEERGVAIYNATIGGELEIYERKDLLNVLDS